LSQDDPLISEKFHIQRAKRNSESRINICLDNMFFHAGFTASGKSENRYFAGYDKMFPGTLVARPLGDYVPRSRSRWGYWLY
jgi:hypothetical protein